MKKILPFLLFYSFFVNAKEFIIKTSDNVLISWQTLSPTTINCTKFETLFDTSNPNNPQHCAEYDTTNPSLCIDIVDFNSAKINNITTTCPKISLDGLLYSADSEISIYQQNRLIIINTSSISNCTNGSGNPPTIGFNFILSVGTVTSGVVDINFNYDTWTLELQSLDGDLVCDGSTGSNNDSLFSNGFE